MYRNRTPLRKTALMCLCAAIVAGPVLPLQASAEAADIVTRELADGVSTYRRANEKAILEEFFALLRLPNYSLNRADIVRNAEHIVDMLERRGVEARILDAGVGAPAVYGELLTPGAETTVIFYVHYDGQPVVPENWTTPPYEPIVKTDYESRGGKVIDFDDLDFPLNPELRIFARSTSDDKAPIIGILTALDALRAQEIEPSINMKFFFEGEEERGSPHLSRMLDAFGHLLEADILFFCDGPVHQSGKKKLSFGVRGPVGFDVTVYGPDRPLHSGHYGNFAPNPIVMLARLIASMRDEDSQVLIDNFYEAVIPPSEVELAAIAELPDIDASLRNELSIGRQESANLSYQESILWPALNLKGIRAGEVGVDSRNAIVTQATASFGYRMVPNQTPELLKRLTEAHLRKQGYHVVNEEPNAETRRSYPKVARISWTDYGYSAVRTPIEHPASQAVIKLLEEVANEKPVLIPSSGGSLPISYFEEALDIPLIMLPIANYDNNQHAENENIRIANLWDGIEIYAAIIAQLGQRYRP